MKNERKNNKSKKMSKKVIFVIILVAIISLLSISLYSNLIDFISNFQKIEVYAEVIVSDYYGISINDTSIVFGILPPGGTSNKDIDLTNNYNRDVKFKIYSEGSIKDFIKVSENNFVLKPNEHKSLSFSVKIPKNISSGKYDGKVIFLVKNPIIK